MTVDHATELIRHTLIMALIVSAPMLIIGLVVGLPLGLLTARWKLFGDTIGTLALGLQTAFVH